MIRDKGYGTGNGSHLVNFANPQESTLVQQGRAGKESPTAGLFRSGTTFRVRIFPVPVGSADRRGYQPFQLFGRLLPRCRVPVLLDSNEAFRPDHPHVCFGRNPFAAPRHRLD